MVHLDSQKPNQVQDYLRRRGWIDTEEVVLTVEDPGEGNMNYTLRVLTANRALIIKQSRAYIEKYPTILAPANRAVTEGLFYQQTQPVPMLANYMPQLLGIDQENNILVLEDLGAVRNYTFLYQPGELMREVDALGLTDYLSELHHQFHASIPDPAFANREMRALHHEQIFSLPFQTENGFDLNTIQPGLQDLSMVYKQDSDLKKIVRELGDVYLADGKTLVHGDYCPGSWLQTPASQYDKSGIKVIDAEFCFYGPAEFDLGIMLAHLMLAQQPVNLLDTILTNYEKPIDFDEKLRQRFTGVEIIRRLIGLVQLPLSLTLEQKQTLLDQARQLIQ